MIIPGGHARAEPSCFLEALDLEYTRTRNRLMIYMLRYHLARYPVDLLRYWFRREGGMPNPTMQRAFESYRAGEKPGPLYKGPPWKPQLRIIEGGRGQQNAAGIVALRHRAQNR